MSDPASDRARRGWRERIEPGLYRAHRLACPRSADRRPGGRCRCPWRAVVPAASPGATRTVTLEGGLAEVRAERRRLVVAGPPPQPAPALEPGTLDEFAAHFLRARAPVLAPSTLKSLEEAYRLRVSPALGGLELAALTRERIEVWLAETAACSSPHAVWKAVKSLRSILAAAVEWGRLSGNPAVGLRLPRRELGASVERVLTGEQLEALFAATGRARVETMFRAAGEAGLRAGEVTGLRWPDLDLAGRRLAVERSVWQEAGAEGGAPRRIVKAPKGGRARRVAISERFAARLADWYVEAVVERGTPADGYVWPGRDGGPMDSSTAGQALARVLRRAELVDDAGAPLVTFHGLRHTAASIMLARGVPLIVVSRQLGHANPNITAQVYAHLLEDAQLDSAAAAFDVPPVAQTLRETLREANAGD